MSPHDQRLSGEALRAEFRARLRCSARRRRVMDCIGNALFWVPGFSTPRERYKARREGRPSWVWRAFVVDEKVKRE